MEASRARDLSRRDCRALWRLVVIKLGLVLTLVSLVVMGLVDRALGARAEFLNACSVWERLLGREPEAEASMVAAQLGAVGELVVVLVANLALGFLLFAALLRGRRVSLTTAVG